MSNESFEIYNEKEIEYLDKYLPLIKNAFDEEELYDIIVECKFNDEKIKKAIQENTKYLESKGNIYGWNEVTNDGLKPVTHKAKDKEEETKVKNTNFSYAKDKIWNKGITKNKNEKLYSKSTNTNDENTDYIDYTKNYYTNDSKYSHNKDSNQYKYNYTSNDYNYNNNSNYGNYENTYYNNKEGGYNTNKYKKTYNAIKKKPDYQQENQEISNNEIKENENKIETTTKIGVKDDYYNSYSNRKYNKQNNEYSKGYNYYYNKDTIGYNKEYNNYGDSNNYNNNYKYSGYKNKDTEYKGKYGKKERPQKSYDSHQQESNSTNKKITRVVEVDQVQPKETRINQPVPSDQKIIEKITSHSSHHQEDSKSNIRNKLDAFENSKIEDDQTRNDDDINNYNNTSNADEEFNYLRTYFDKLKAPYYNKDMKDLKEKEESAKMNFNHQQLIEDSKTISKAYNPDEFFKVSSQVQVESNSKKYNNNSLRIESSSLNNSNLSTNHFQVYISPSEGGSKNKYDNSNLNTTSTSNSNNKVQPQAYPINNNDLLNSFQFNPYYQNLNPQMKGINTDTSGYNNFNYMNNPYQFMNPYGMMPNYGFDHRLIEQMNQQQSKTSNSSNTGYSSYFNPQQMGFMNPNLSKDVQSDNKNQSQPMLNPLLNPYLNMNIPYNYMYPNQGIQFGNEHLNQGQNK